MKLTTAFQELNLNIKHQMTKVDEFSQIGYEFEKGNYVFCLMLPLPFKSKSKLLEK